MSGRNLPPFYHNGDVKAHADVWMDKISTDAVIVTFPEMMVDGRITLGVLKLINRDRHT